jgi:5-amino-6-(5-phosphoribosylamino)uracil reductase
MVDQRTSRPHVVLSCAMSVDGYIDDAGPRRLLVSNDEDFDRVDGERATADAILVGAATIRADDPRLLVRSEARRTERRRQGRPANPRKVTITATGDLDPAAAFFAATGGEPGALGPVVYCPTTKVAATRDRLAGTSATVVGAGDPLELAVVLDDLVRRDVERLLVEGGSQIHTQFLAAGLVDEVHLAIGPFFVGGGGAPRFVADAAIGWDSDHRMVPAEVRQLGEIIVIRYLLPPLTERHRDHP